MAEFDRKALRAIFEGADLEVPPKDVLGKICDLHTSNSDGKDETIKDLRTKLESAEQERDALKAKGGDDYKAKYEKVKKDFDDYKADQTAKETKAAKEKAVRDYVSERDFGGKKITGENLEIAMMALAGMIDGVELDGEKIKDASSLNSVIDSKLARLAVETKTRGANPATPPAGNGGRTMTRDDIYKRDENGRFLLDASQRQTALAQLNAAQQQKG